jgi:signal transduction histidine kinase
MTADKPCLIVVDDEDAALYLKSFVLRRAGHAVIEARTGREALRAVADHQPELVLLDVHLPDISGIDVCQQIKKDHPDILVLQTSATFTNTRDRTVGLESGADSYLTEPVEPEELLATVTALMRMRKAEDALRRMNQTLEQRVEERTRQLGEMNRQLLDEMREREAAEEALRQSQKMEAVGQLTGGVAHDFNNLLTVIGGNLDLLEGADDPAKRQRLLRAAQKAVDRGQQLTQHLLAFARRQPLRTAVTDINALLRAFLDLLHRAVGENVRVETDLAEDLWLCRLDPAQFEAALLNLAVNARDAMPEGGTITISTRNVAEGTGAATSAAPPGVVVVMADTGTGMPSELVGRVFEPFFTTKETGKGSGLGLSQVYGFIKQSGGEVRIESEPGRGTRVSLRLPRTTEAPVPSAAPPGVPMASIDGRTILVVEDNDDVLEVAVAMLADLGYGVLTARNAAEATALLEGGALVDVLFTDVVMPGGASGIDLARRARETYPELKVLLTSGYAAQLAAVDNVGPGFAVIGKPYRRAELQQKLVEMFRGMTKS